MVLSIRCSLPDLTPQKNLIPLSVFPYLYLPSECSNSSFLSFLSLLSALSSSISFLVRPVCISVANIVFQEFWVLQYKPPIIWIIKFNKLPHASCLLPLRYTLSIISSGLVMLNCLIRLHVLIQASASFSFSSKFVPSVIPLNTIFFLCFSYSIFLSYLRHHNKFNLRFINMIFLFIEERGSASRL